MTPTCPRDGMPYRFDFETYRQSLDSYGEAHAIYRWGCPMGHGWPAPVSGSRLETHTPRHPEVVMKPCAWCGSPIPMTGHAHLRKLCSPACRKAVGVARQAAMREGKPFRLENQPWFQGPGATRIPEPQRPAEPPPPFTLGRDWLDGWCRAYYGRVLSFVLTFSFLSVTVPR